MYPRSIYEMSQEDFNELIESCKPVPYIMVGGITPSSPQENANNAWKRLGIKMGFDSETVQPINGKSQLFFTAIPSEISETKKMLIMLGKDWV